MNEKDIPRREDAALLAEYERSPWHNTGNDDSAFFKKLAQAINHEIQEEYRRMDEEFIKLVRMEAAGDDLIKRWVIEAGLDR